MADYRDDEISSATVAESYVATIGNKLYDTAVAAFVVASFVGFHVNDTAAATDQVQDALFHAVTEQATPADSVVMLGGVLQTVIDTPARARDAITLIGVDRFEEVITASDEISDVRGDRLSDVAFLSEEYVDVLSVTTEITETARAADSVLLVRSERLEDAVVASDFAASVSTIRMDVSDTATASDDVLDTRALSIDVFEAATASDAIVQTLSARSLVTERGFAEDMTQDGRNDQAWTANVKAFATSRYAPYTFDGVAVINGQLYGTSPQGVFKLDDPLSAETISGSAATPTLALSDDPLVIPNEVYMDYSADADISIDVTTLHSGVPATYSYSFPDKPALTNTTNRAVLGRGLRGKYYAFTLRVSGTKARIEKLFAAIRHTQRRI